MDELKIARERCPATTDGGRLRCWGATGHDLPHWWLRDDAGRVAPIAPDPERDRRRAAYAERERAAAHKALGHYDVASAEARAGRRGLLDYTPDRSESTGDEMHHSPDSVRLDLSDS